MLSPTGIIKMAIKYKIGSLLKEDAEALVNTVNTVGVMGKGIALQFKEKYSLNYKLYKNACKANEVAIGKMFVTETNFLTNPKYIINFPTKQHWKGFSKLEYIVSGLDDLVSVIKFLKIKSIALPPLGCGNGGLQWSVVKPIIVAKLSTLENLEVIVYEPSSEAYSVNRERTKPAPKLTSLRALALYSLLRYKELGYELTILEVQKLIYLLQRLGLNFNLEFVKQQYGPYANKLQYVLNDLDGYYLTGMKHNSAKPFDKLSIIAEKIGIVKDYVEKECTRDERNKIQILNELIEGFESPLGMELLATVDMLLQENKELQFDNEAIIVAIKNWNDRKAKLMKPEYVKITIDRLKEKSNYLYH